MDPTCYGNSMHDTISLCASDLSLAYFSEVNTDYLQKRIQNEFYRLTGIVIQKQRVSDLLMLMRYVFVARSVHQEAHHAQQLAELNQHVVDTALPQIATSVEQYYGYIRDASTMAVPLERPTATTIKGETPLVLAPF